MASKKNQVVEQVVEESVPEIVPEWLEGSEVVVEDAPVVLVLRLSGCPVKARLFPLRLPPGLDLLERVLGWHDVILQ